MTAPHAIRRGGAPPPRRSGFTLVEMLVVMVIIAMLSAMVLGALASVNETARAAKTKATIGKIHTQLTHRWDSYRTRRLPISINVAANETPQAFAARRLRCLWALQRIEMPDDYSDLDLANVTNTTRGGDPSFLELTNNALPTAYAFAASGAQNTPDTANASAECLYLTVTVGMDADDELGFLDNEFARPDPQRPPVFIDGWGRPIRWIRWAPGYVPNTGAQPPLSADTDFQRADPPGASFQPNPFDPRGLCRPGSSFLTPAGNPSFYGQPSWGFKLMPLVFSAGPDGEMGVQGMRSTEQGVSGATYDPSVSWHPYALHNGQWRGTPAPGLEGGGHMDNITNHRLGTR